MILCAVLFDGYIRICHTQIQYMLLDSTDSDVQVLIQGSDTADFSDLAIDSPSGWVYLLLYSDNAP